MMQEMEDRQKSINEERKRAIEGLRNLSRPFPPGFKFDREEAHERRGSSTDIPWRIFWCI